MKSGFFALGVSCLCLALGCGSDDDDSSKSATAGASGKGTGGSNASQAGSSNSGGSTGTSGSAAQAGNTTSGGSSEVPATEACKKYCTCHDTNCPTYAIPGGKSCAAFCAAMTEDQLACRQNMCKLVPDQPDNDHCTHSLGINQCE